MDIRFNGKTLTVKEELTLGQLILEKGLNPDTVIVEYNNELVKQGHWAQIVLKENDTLEVLRFVGGG
ncbi:sulfur carrier protein ThiS [Desulforamulus ruminis]|uniref:sulfur carrier protein ThiS n=1 Tax=Desulforamulus ruminis TaxID=1564 RepID=UPI00235387D2|nr:sulfur carrier protein ThiS [Desulforamulus ruminis]